LNLEGLISSCNWNK